MGRTAARSVFLQFFLALGFLTAVPNVVTAQENALERSSVDESYDEINDLIVNLQGAIGSAEEALGTVKNMPVDEGKEATDALFSDMKIKVKALLDGLGPNSVLVDNLEGAKANTIVLKRWFERQPPEYPNRDNSIIRLDEVIKQHEALGDSIQAGRQDAQNALKEVSRAQFIRKMELKVRSAERSVEVTKRVLTSLRDLSSRIRVLADEEMPGPISN